VGKVKCDIYFSHFDSDRINQEGWEGEEGKLYMRITGPFSSTLSIDALDEALDKGKYRFVGSLELKSPEQAWGIVQNIDEGHPLNDRSMMIGDVVICGDVGKMVETTGWSDLSQEQIDKFENFIS
jgi:hypothetical protein